MAMKLFRTTDKEKITGLSVKKSSPTQKSKDKGDNRFISRSHPSKKPEELPLKVATCHP
jgi:hypothetical protein